MSRFLLSSAGNMAGIAAAHQSGADAVCFPLPRNEGAVFAREAIAYCLPRGVRSLLFIDSRPTDKELSALAPCIAELCAAGLDGAVLRDAGLFRMFKQIFPDGLVHISPFAGVNTVRAAKFWYSMGASHIWLPPFLSRERTAYILRNSPVPCGVMAEGTLCFGLSEYCAMTAGSRGDCRYECLSLYGISEKPSERILNLQPHSMKPRREDLELMGAESFCVFDLNASPEWTAEKTREWREIIDGGVSAPHLVDVKFSCLIQAGEPVRVAVQDNDGNVVRVKGPRPSRSEAAPLEAAINTQFYKLGGTFYNCAGARSHIGGGLTVPLNVIAELRKSALDQLTELRSKPPRRTVGIFHAGAKYLPRQEAPVITVWVRHMSQLTRKLSELKPALVYVPLMELEESGERLLSFFEAKIPVCAWMPRGIGDDERSALHKALGAASSLGIKCIAAPCAGYFDLLQRSGFDVCSDGGINVTNSQTLKEYKRLGLKSVLLSHELPLNTVREMSHVLDTELQVYGRVPLAFCERCFMKTAKGMCACDNKSELIDEQGARAPILREYKCRTGIYSPAKLFWGDRVGEFNNLGLWGIRLVFITENAIECVAVTERYMRRGRYEPGEYTRGILEKI
ncbi:MAG: DUF3656 domain-containing protein [Oscillospiraceae bacterium]|nr:DUF3656 domain-containing protein [Oscillospiraceae bacterium]